MRALRRRDRHRDALARRPVEGRSVTVLTLPFSPMDAGSSASVTTGSASSSGIVSVRAAGAATPLPPVTAPVTVTLLSGASTPLFFAGIVTAPVLDV